MLVSALHMLVFHADLQAARHLISALDSLATLSGGREAAAGERDGRRGRTTALRARGNDGKQSRHGSYP